MNDNNAIWGNTLETGLNKNELKNKVTSVNGKTGAVELTAADVGATTEQYVDDAIAAIDLPTGGGEWVLLHSSTAEEAVSIISAEVENCSEYIVRLVPAVDEKVQKLLDLQINGVRVSEAMLPRDRILTHIFRVIVDYNAKIAWITTGISLMGSALMANGGTICGFRDNIPVAEKTTLSTSTYGNYGDSSTGAIFAAGTTFEIWGLRQ